jgi:hypothetical protein
MRNRNRATQVVLLACVLGVFALTLMTADERYVAVPGFACIVMTLWLWLSLWDRDRRIPFFDVGVFCALATLIYSVYPLVNFWVDGLRFGFLSDGRLQQYQISPEELGIFHLRHVLYLFSFVVTYALYRGRGPVETGNVRSLSRSNRQVILLFFLILTGYFFVLGMLTGADYSSAETYHDRIAIEQAVTSTMPLLLLQISQKLLHILFIFKLALLFIVVSRCRQRKWLIILLVWISAELVQTFYMKGGRSAMVAFLMATALLYHRMIKPLSMKFLMISGASLLIFFNFLGLYRAYVDFVSLRAGLSYANSGIFSGGNEFQSLLGTAYDVFQRKEGGAHLPWYLYINDFITLLPPQQIMPFEKVSASEWYLREIGRSGTGQGYMWGVITQSIVGLDWLELAFRGAILGYILARFHRWYLKHQTGFLETLLYMFFCLKVYYTFRDTTFTFLSNLIWEVIPFYILLRIGVFIFHRKIGGQSGRRIAMPTPQQ